MRGLKPSIAIIALRRNLNNSNNADPREGIKTADESAADPATDFDSNNADPREGIKTASMRDCSASKASIQITLILVRGLKLSLYPSRAGKRQTHSNNADPREGIKTALLPTLLQSVLHSNNADPREGIKTKKICFLNFLNNLHSNNADPREGIKTRFHFNGR